MFLTPFKSLNHAYSNFIREVIFPWHQRRWYPQAERILAECKHLEFAPGEEIQRRQGEQLGRLLRHAIETVPHYRDQKKMLNETDLRSFPVLDKNTLRQFKAQLLSDRADRDTLLPNASGGSTGKPVQLFQDRNYWEHATASQWFVEGWWGLHPGERTAAIWGNDRDMAPKAWRERITIAIFQHAGCNAFRLDEARMLEFARLLQKWEPRFVIGYATALDLFARLLLAHPELEIHPVAVKSTAEMLTAAERERIEAAFQAPLYDFYGSREINNVAAQCRERQGLHVNALHRIVEIVDDRGEPVPPGVLGRVLVTDLTNYSMPMIRYENEDISSWEAGDCACGRHFPRLTRIMGRKSDFLLSRTGRIIHGEFFTHLFYPLHEVREFQVVQESLDLTRVDVVLHDRTKVFDSASLVAAMQAALGGETHIEVKAVESIDRPSSGKHRFTISKLGMPWGSDSRHATSRSER